jgi:hypothetical protein
MWDSDNPGLYFHDPELANRWFWDDDSVGNKNTYYVENNN